MSSTARPVPESYIPEFQALEDLKNEPDDLVALEKLISIGAAITSYTASDIRDGFGKANPYFHHDLRKLFSHWRGYARRLLKRNANIARDEYEVLEESDTVPSVPLVHEEPDFSSVYADTLLKNIQLESSRRLEALRTARSKIETSRKWITPADGKKAILSFDSHKSRLYVRGNEFKIRKFSDQYHILRIIFEDPKDTPQEWFFSELVERIDRYKKNDKTYYNASYQIRDKLAKKGFAEFLITTKQSAKINPKYLS